MRTLIFHDGALGDVLLSLPCITAVGRQGLPPDIVCRDDVGRLLRSSGVVHGAFSSDRGLFSSWYAGYPVDAARELVSRYDRVYVFTHREGSDLAMGIARTIPDRQVIITVPPAGSRTHVAAFRLRQLPPAMRHAAPVRLFVAPAIGQQAREVLALAGHDGQELIVLHPGSGGKLKCWPLMRYFSLAERMAEASGAFILFLSGPAEERPVKEQIEQFTRDRTAMAHIADADLAIVSGMIAGSVLYIGNDSGITHLAAAVGAPVIALFGPSDPVLWAPRGRSVRVAAAATLEGITADAVLAAAEETGTWNFCDRSRRDIRIYQ